MKVRRHRAVLALFLAPALLLFASLVLGPILLALYTSLFEWNGFGGLPTNFIGLDNFVRLLTDDVFLGDLERGLILIVLSVTIQLPFSLALALLVNQKLRMRSVYRVVFFAPYVLSEVITGVLFTLILSPGNGLMNALLGAVGIGAQAWIGNTSTVLFALFSISESTCEVEESRSSPRTTWSMPCSRSSTTTARL